MGQRAESKHTEPDEKHRVKCPYCQRRFQSQDELTLHIVTRHTQSSLMSEPAQSGSK